jgi:hypothetical protein
VKKNVIKKKMMTPSDNEAFNCLEIVMKWYEKLDECKATQLLTLKCLQDLSAGKYISPAKQTSLLESV